MKSLKKVEKLWQTHILVYIIKEYIFCVFLEQISFNLRVLKVTVD